MAQVGFFDQWFFGAWADRRAINETSNELYAVEGNVQQLNQIVAQQRKELLQLRALVLGLVEVMHRKAPFDEAELQKEVEVAYDRLLRPPPPPPMPPANPYAAGGDPYRGTPAQERPPEPMVTCSVCQQAVAQSRTNITGNGLVCDRCLR